MIKVRHTSNSQIVFPVKTFTNPCLYINLYQNRKQPPKGLFACTCEILEDEKCLNSKISIFKSLFLLLSNYIQSTKNELNYKIQDNQEVELAGDQLNNKVFQVQDEAKEEERRLK